MHEYYRCVTTVKGVQNYIGENSIVAFDFETAPDDPYREDYNAALDPAKAHIVGCSFSVEEGTGIYVPIAHRTGINIDKEAFFEFIGNFLRDKKIIKIAHNIAFESSIAYAMGIVVQAPVFDTMSAAQMTLKGMFKFRSLKDNDCGLKKLAEEICNVELPSFNNVTDGKHFDELDANDVETVRYGSADADFAFRLYNRFNSWFDCFLPKHRFIVEEIESPTAVYMGIMKFNGVPIDLPLMKKRKKETELEIDRIRQKIISWVGDIDIGSNCATQAFKKYLFVDQGLPVLKFTENNQPAFDDMAIVLLMDWCAKNKPSLLPLLFFVQEYRKWNKAKSTYIDGYMNYINTVTGCIHPDFFNLCTGTGRMNCCSPNLQNMPRSANDVIGVRDFIRAPEKHTILSFDFSQIELRVTSFYCRDEVMMNVYQKNGDIHAATTSLIFNISYDEAQDKNSTDYKERRTIAKNINFGTVYGLYPIGLQSTLKFKAGIEKSISECEQIIRNLKCGYKKLTIWQEKIKTETNKKQYVETWLGRRRYLPEIKSSDWSKRTGAERCALNTPIQGTAADILKLAMARILEGLAEREWLKPVIQIHDELVFIVPENKVDDAVVFIRECMETKPFAEFDIPLVADAAKGYTFGNMKEIDR